MTEQRKQIVSLRMSATDLRKVREIARRLSVRESDVFRFAIKTTLAKLGPLYEQSVRGSDLVPIFIECGSELATYFDLDSTQLEAIINGGVDDPLKRVDKDDIELLAMSGAQEHYLYKRLKQVVTSPSDSVGTSALLRRYLFAKYISDGGQVLEGGEGRIR